jgi:hypothetical protein
MENRDGSIFRNCELQQTGPSPFGDGTLVLKELLFVRVLVRQPSKRKREPNQRRNCMELKRLNLYEFIRLLDSGSPVMMGAFSFKEV